MLCENPHLYSMNLFFSPSEFNYEDNLIKLHDTVNYISKFDKISFSHNDYLKSFSSEVLRVSCSSRALNLLRLRLFESFDFFDSPSFNDMFQCVDKNPEKVIGHFNHRFSQALTLLILKIHRDMKGFSNQVLKMLKFDPTLNFVFAYSTFPAIFGYFTIDVFSNLAGDFLINLIQNDFNESMKMILNPLIASYFISNHQFIYYLWHLFENRVQKKTKNVDEAFNVFCDCLKLCVIHLSHKHSIVLSIYSSIDTANCISLLYTDVFAQTYKEKFFLLNSSDNYFYNYLIELSNNPLNDTPRSILSILTKTAQRNSTIINDDIISQVKKMPIVMSDRDLCTIIEIYQSDKSVADINLLSKSTSILFKRGYLPFYVDIILPIQHKNEPNNEQLKNEENNVHDLSRMFLRYQNYAKIENKNFLKILENHFSVNNFEKYSLNRYVNEFSRQIDELDFILNLKLTINKLKRERKNINFVKDLLMIQFAEGHAKSILQIGKKTHLHSNYNLICKKLFSDSHTQTPTSIFFATCIQAMNLFKMTKIRGANELSAAYTRYSSDTLLKNVHSWTSENPFLAKNLIYYIHYIRNTIDLQYGYRVYYLLNFMKSLKNYVNFVDSKTEYNSFVNGNYKASFSRKRCNLTKSRELFQNMFNLVIEEANSREVIATMLSLNVLFINLKKLTIPAPFRDIEKLQDLFNTFVTLISDDKCLLNSFSNIKLKRF
ncbi:hypothetical protein TRFO_39051 [Tritrichomonas foetus]|uniref:Uncharacterized protein n=1 Tax=Tritrichomonas foetus TaxID=1144522 RepID=A0A1J4JAU9_9EUKA|nr:hypothetical protein TRFO_39051 [Tritrichomonas foetus]|eukprot:OHS94779.1 hypothetical protein TRFO_39051 [Tritrichomonas foetus]